MLSVAYLFNTNVKKLQRINDFPDPDYNLVPGQKLFVIDHLERKQHPDKVQFIEKVDYQADHSKEIHNQIDQKVSEDNLTNSAVLSIN